MFAQVLRRMSRPSALQRTRQVAQHMWNSSAASASTGSAVEPTVLFESNGFVRRYILNRPKKLNALDLSMIRAVGHKLQEWETSELCGIVVGDGSGKAFCAGGDVETVIRDGADPETRSRAINFFKEEFELDYQLATLWKPYVVICDGFTMGGGVGLSAHAPFRIATENTKFAMPETNIGYSPDVGASFFLSRLDGEIGPYLGLTSYNLTGRAVFENGLATHFVPSRRIPQLLSQLAALDKPSLRMINSLVEEHYGEPLAEETSSAIKGEIRDAVDTAFAHDTVEEIFASLKKLQQAPSEPVAKWAKDTLATLELRSPTSLKIALRAIRLGKGMTLADALRMEMGIATAFLSGASKDFETGVTAVLIEKKRGVRPEWNPKTLEEVSEDLVKKFFDSESEYVKAAPALALHDKSNSSVQSLEPTKFTLPTEHEIEQLVRGLHSESSSVAYNLGNLIQKFCSMTGDKHGVEAKIREVVARRCEEVADPDGQRWLRWK